MRILHVVLTPRHSGAEILVRDLARVHVSEGHSVGVCALNPAEEAFKVEIERSILDGVQWFLPKRPLKKLERARTIRRVCRQFKADVVVAHAATPSIWTRVGMCASRVPIVSVLHDASEDDFGMFPLYAIEMILRFRNSAVVAVSKKASENYGRRFGQESKLAFIKNGVDLDKIKSAEGNRENLREKYGLLPLQKMLLQVGRITSSKGQLYSLNAVVSLLRNNPQLVLWFVGIIEDKEYHNSLQQLITSGELADQVEILGSRDDIPELLAASDIFLMPSAKEAHSVALLEALASGSECIISNIDVFKFAEGFEGVHLVDINDVNDMRVIIGECRDVDMRYRRDLEEYSINGTANRYLELFRSI